MNPSECCSSCDDATTVNTPGTSGTNGKNAFTTITANLTVPVDTVTPVTGTFADTSWMVPGQSIIIGNAGGHATFTVNGTPASSTSASLLWQDVDGDQAAASTIASGAAVSPSGKAIKLTGVTQFTDNSTGAASSTIAAGVGVSKLVIPHTFIGGTAAVEPVTNYTVGFKFKILSWAWVTEVLLVGAGGSRVANMEINSTDVGTVASTVTVVIASAAVGTVIAGTAVAGANTGSATDTFSIEIASGGTAFTAGSGTFIITIQNMDDADAYASIASKVNSILTAMA